MQDKICLGAVGSKIYWGVFPLVFGSGFLAGTEQGLCSLAFVDDNLLPAVLSALSKRWPQAALCKDPSKLAGVAAEINRCMQSGSEVSHVPLLVAGSPFQLKVWQALQAIPAGQVATYQNIATVIGMPTVARAVGNAVGANPLAYLIPCHRVIRANGDLGQYHWGAELKRSMLAAEGRTF